jgi:hypothetical protein
MVAPTPANGEPVPYDDPPPLVAEEPAVIPPPVDGLESMMAELSGAMLAKVTVYRINKNGPAAYVYQCTPEAFNLDDLRNVYGGGEFRLYIMKDGQFYRNLKVVVEPKQIEHAAAPVFPGKQETTALGALEARLARQDDLISEFYRQNMGAPQRQSILGDLDLPATITAISAAIVALRPPAPPPPPPAPEGNVDRAIDMLLKGIELAKELRNDSGEGDSMMGVLRDLIKSPMLAQAVAAAVPPGAQPPQPQVFALPPTPPAQPPIRGESHSAASQHLASAGVFPGKQPTQPEPFSMDVPQQPQLLQAGVPEFDAVGPAIIRYLPLLCFKAMEGSSSQLYAEVILDSTPEGMIEPILEHTTGEICEYLALIYPPVRTEWDWFVSLVDEMRLMLEEEGEPLPPDVGPLATPGSTTPQ